MRSFLIALTLGSALVTPMTVRADDHPKRYYDRNQKDWHEWNDSEDRAFRRYLEEQHRAYHGWDKANRKEQDSYWKWRHDHPDR
jgi:hypothetical protein